jgi:nicotinamide riboside kinase
MLIGQAVYAIEIFLNKTIDKQIIVDLYEEMILKKQNIVLIGMPSCGKTTIGKKLAKKINRKFYDVDKEIADDQFLTLQQFHKDHPEIIVCYIPIEFPVVDDGVRSVDEGFREEVDFMIKNLLDCAEINYHTITGTVEERIKMIDELLK